jgi:hypothetical protein
VDSCGCKQRSSAAPAVARATWRRRVVSTVEWVLPAATLAVIPKCPACVAGYVLLFTGVGLTLPAATAVRWTLIAVCTGALLFLAARAVHRRFLSSA